MVDWHPSRLAQPVEWMLQHPVSPRPFAVIRLIRFPAQTGTVDAWYRVVTWAEKSPGRELIGWCLSLEAATEAAWDYFRALSSWQHAQAASRMHERAGGAPPKPPAHDLLLAYRAAARDAALHSAQDAVQDAAQRGSLQSTRGRAAAVRRGGAQQVAARGGSPSDDAPRVRPPAPVAAGRSLRNPGRVLHPADAR